LFEAISDRADATRTDAKALIQLTREHATPMFLSLAIIFQGWARARLGERDAGLADLCEGLTNYARQGNRTFLPLIWGLLAGIEAESRGAEGALTRVDEALALAVETGEHWTDSFLHRVRGKILLEHDSSNTVSAEEPSSLQLL
jgi:predicted ATPase